MKVSVYSTWIVGWVEAFYVFSVTDPVLQYQQHTTEWAIPYDNTKACLHELHDWMMHELSDPKGLRPHWPIEVRFSDSDDIWLSPSNGRKTCWIGIVQFKYVTYCVFSALPETLKGPMVLMFLTRSCLSALKLSCTATAAGRIGPNHTISVPRHFADCIPNSTTLSVYCMRSTLVGCFATNMLNVTYLARRAQDTTLESSSATPFRIDLYFSVIQ